MKRVLITIYCFLCPLFLFCGTPRQLILTSPSYIEGAGLFHNFHIVLGLLKFYEDDRFASLTVDFGDKGLYYEPKYGGNWWSYYFEPIELNPIMTQTKRRSIVKCLSDEEKAYFGNSALFYFSRKLGSSLIEKYIKLKPFLIKEIENFVRENFSEIYTIGVHYRGSDKKAEAPLVSLEKVKICLKSQIKKLKSSDYKIFLATDERVAVEYFQKYFPNKLIYQKGLYSKDGVGAHYIHRGFESGRRAVIDCYLLSKCHLLIRTSSNLSAASAFINPKLPLINLNKIYTKRAAADESRLNEINTLTKNF